MATSLPLPARRVALPTTQGALHAYLVEGYDALDARLRACVATLAPEALSTRPPAGGWSVGEILEHCCLLNEGYLRALEAVVAGAAVTRADDGAALPWREGLVVGLLRRSLESSFRMPAPRAIHPGPAPRPDVLAALVASHDRMRALLARSARLPWRRLRVTSPFSALVRPNVGEVGLIVLRHGERHAGQIERTAAAVRGAAGRG